MRTFEGKVISAKYSDYLTEKYGIPEDNIKGYTLHVLINKIDGESINLHCFELQCYADYEIQKDGKITYLNLVKPFYEVSNVEVASTHSVAIGESYMSLRGESFNNRKIKNDKEYRMLSTRLPLCVIKRPLISDIWLPEETEEYISNERVTPLIRDRGGLV